MLRKIVGGGKKGRKKSKWNQVSVCAQRVRFTSPKLDNIAALVKFLKNGRERERAVPLSEKSFVEDSPTALFNIPPRTHNRIAHFPRNMFPPYTSARSFVPHFLLLLPPAWPALSKKEPSPSTGEPLCKCNAQFWVPYDALFLAS